MEYKITNCMMKVNEKLCDTIKLSFDEHFENLYGYKGYYVKRDCLGRIVLMHKISSSKFILVCRLVKRYEGFTLQMKIFSTKEIEEAFGFKNILKNRYKKNNILDDSVVPIFFDSVHVIAEFIPKISELNIKKNDYFRAYPITGEYVRRYFLMIRKVFFNEFGV